MSVANYQNSTGNSGVDGIGDESGNNVGGTGQGYDLGTRNHRGLGLFPLRFAKLRGKSWHLFLGCWCFFGRLQLSIFGSPNGFLRQHTISFLNFMFWRIWWLGLADFLRQDNRRGVIFNLEEMLQFIRELKPFFTANGQFGKIKVRWWRKMKFSGPGSADSVQKFNTVVPRSDGNNVVNNKISFGCQFYRGNGRSSHALTCCRRSWHGESFF